MQFNTMTHEKGGVNLVRDDLKLLDDGGEIPKS